MEINEKKQHKIQKRGGFWELQKLAGCGQSVSACLGSESSSSIKKSVLVGIVLI